MDITPDRALIYAIIKGGVSSFQAAKGKGVEAEHLSFDDQTIFQAMEDVFLPKGKMPSLADIKLHLKIELDPCDEDFDVELCADEIVSRALATKLGDGLGPILDKVATEPKTARDELSELVHNTNWSMGEVARTGSPSAIEEIEKRYLEAKNRTGSLLGYSSPWPARDKQSLGLQPGEVTVLLAKRKTGKSWLLFKWAEHIWTAKREEDGEPELKAGESILIVSMEMPVWQVLRRLFAIHNKLDYEEFRSGKLTRVEEEKFFKWCEEMKKPDTDRSEIIVVGSDKVRTVRDLVGMVAQYRPKVVFIDGFYILGRSDRAQRALWERTMSNISDIKLDVAVGLNVPVVATTQLSGQVKRGDLNAEADAVAYAKSIGDYADAIDGLFGNDKFRDSKRRILRGMEAREFVTVDIEINFDPQLHDYSEIRVLDSDDGDSGGFENADDDDDSLDSYDGELVLD